MTVASTPLAVRIAGGFSIDSIVYEHGAYETERLGGNALWAAMGARSLGVEPEAYAVVGGGYPADALERVGRLGVDVTRVRRAPALQGVRVTYAYASDGSRVQPADAAAVATVPQPARALFVDTTRSPSEILGALPTPADLPEDNRDSAWHLGLLPLSRFRELVTRLRATSAAYIQADAPARLELRRDGLDALAEMLPAVDVFLPSTSDTDVFLPDHDRSSLLRTFHGLGAKLVVLKCGEDGAIISDRSGARWHLPAYPEPRAVDPTGSGDVFAGAFAAVVADGGGLVDAACAGAAVASSGTRYRSPLDLAAIDGAEITERRRYIRGRLQRI